MVHVSLGPSYGYYVNEEKTWLVVKPDYLNQAWSVFNDTKANITLAGRPYLGSPLGSVTYMKGYVKSKVELWNNTLRSLSEIAKLQPHAVYCAFTNEVSSQWLYFC